MKYILLILLLTNLLLSNGLYDSRRFNEYTLKAKDSVGLYIEYTDELGIMKLDSGTILMESNRDYILTKRNMEKTIIQKGNISCLNIKRMNVKRNH